MVMVPAQSVEDDFMYELIGLNQWTPNFQAAHRLVDETMGTINLPKRPKHKTKKSDDSCRQIQRQ
jgi:hypothetical protein